MVNPMQSPNVGPGGKDFGNKDKTEMKGDILKVIRTGINKGLSAIRIYRSVRKQFPDLSPSEIDYLMSELN